MTTFPQENTSKLHNKNNELHNNRGENAKMVTSKTPINHNEDEFRKQIRAKIHGPSADDFTDDLMQLFTSHLQSAVEEASRKAMIREAQHRASDALDRLLRLDKKVCQDYIKEYLSYLTPIKYPIQKNKDAITQLTTNKGKE